jgi:hypothetical protein
MVRAPWPVLAPTKKVPTLLMVLATMSVVARKSLCT